MPEPTTVKVNGRYQISLPSRTRQQLHIKAGDRLLIDVQDGVIILTPQSHQITWRTSPDCTGKSGETGIPRNTYTRRGKRGRPPTTFNIRPADALIVATAVTHGATAFITNDKTLRRLDSVISILALDSFVEN